MKQNEVYLLTLAREQHFPRTTKVVVVVVNTDVIRNCFCSSIEPILVDDYFEVVGCSCCLVTFAESNNILHYFNLL